jgi:hypothetical protein
VWVWAVREPLLLLLSPWLFSPPPVVSCALYTHVCSHVHAPHQDIYIQRWRMEDLPWRVEIGDWIEVWNATAGVFYLVNATSGEISNLTIATPKELVTMHALALDSHTYRNITGQVRTLPSRPHPHPHPHPPLCLPPARPATYSHRHLPCTYTAAHMCASLRRLLSLSVLRAGGVFLCVSWGLCRVGAPSSPGLRTLQTPRTRCGSHGASRQSRHRRGKKTTRTRTSPTTPCTPPWQTC